MCGILGIVGGDPTRERAAAEAMSDAIAHRGPDGHGIESLEGAILGTRRLAIIDPAAPGRPIANQDRTLWIAFNGEIYNHRQLREELIARGHRFETATDTEVVVHLFEEEGADCLRRLRGMFAFAIWNVREQTLFAARDPFGQKPFHYASAGGRFLFASEIKGILRHPQMSTEPEPVAIDHYLAQRFVPPPLTMFRGVHKLPAGQLLWLRGGEIRTQSYWSPRYDASERRSDEEWIEELEARIDSAVERHLVSDVPVGALLSGGLDSSVVVAGMAKTMGPDFPTFCVGTEIAEFDERGHAGDVARHFGTRHHERSVGDEALRGIPTLIRALDEPSDPISACTYEAARLASQSVKVVLGGDGGDEIFGGFDRYAAFDRAERFNGLPGWLRESALRPLAHALPGAINYKSIGQRARWLSSLGGERGGRLYARMTSVFRFGPDQKEWLYGPYLRQAVGELDAEACIAEAFDRAPARDSLHRMLYADVVTRLPEHSLLMGDRLSMAHGLELRSPLLDQDLAEFCARMPAHLKVRGSATKVGLRRAYERRLPQSILRRPKQGFMLPMAQWLRDGSLETLCDRLERGPLVREGWVAPGAAARLAREHASGRADHHARLWMLLNLDAWSRICLGLGGGSEGPADSGSFSTKSLIPGNRPG